MNVAQPTSQPHLRAKHSERLAASSRTLRLEQDWFFHYLLRDDASIDARDREVFAAAYSSPDALRAGDAWYQAFPQDIIDDDAYPRLTMPVLALGGPGYGPRRTLSRYDGRLGSAVSRHTC